MLMLVMMTMIMMTMAAVIATMMKRQGRDAVARHGDGYACEDDGNVHGGNDGDADELEAAWSR